MAGLRRKARILALQTLFEVDLAKHDPERALDYLLEDATVASEGSDFARQLVKGVLEHRPQIDDLIHEAAPTWPLEQMARVDKNILRLAIYEILFDTSVPMKAAINEAVELAKSLAVIALPSSSTAYWVDHGESV